MSIFILCIVALKSNYKDYMSSFIGDRSFKYPGAKSRHNAMSFLPISIENITCMFMRETLCWSMLNWRYICTPSPSNWAKSMLVHLKSQKFGERMHVRNRQAPTTSPLRAYPMQKRTIRGKCFIYCGILLKDRVFLSLLNQNPRGQRWYYDSKSQLQLNQLTNKTEAFCVAQFPHISRSGQ